VSIRRAFASNEPGRTALPTRKQDCRAVVSLDLDLGLDPLPRPRRANLERLSREELVAQLRRRADCACAASS
jgi:hypothetical protein